MDEIAQGKAGGLLSDLSSWFDHISATVAEFVQDQPLLASAVAVIAVALILYLVSKLIKTAIVAILGIALIVGIIVFFLGPDQARSYLDQIRGGPPAESGK